MIEKVVELGETELPELSLRRLVLEESEDVVGQHGRVCFASAPVPPELSHRSSRERTARQHLHRLERREKPRAQAVQLSCVHLVVQTCVTAAPWPRPRIPGSGVRNKKLGSIPLARAAFTTGA